MATPKEGYYLDGKRIPGTTTIIGRFKESGGLIHWAWDLGMQGINYRDVRDTAAGIGTIAHDMVECYIRSKIYTPPDNITPETLKKAQTSFIAFLKWAEETKLEPAETEIQLVSKEYRYGGTPDVLFVKGVRTLGDWKTSSSVRPDYLYQLAAYMHLWNENYPDDPITGGAHLIRFDKEYGDFHHHYYTDLDDAWTGFKLMRELYDLDKILKKRAA